MNNARDDAGIKDFALYILFYVVVHEIAVPKVLTCLTDREIEFLTLRIVRCVFCNGKSAAVANKLCRIVKMVRLGQGCVHRDAFESKNESSDRNWLKIKFNKIVFSNLGFPLGANWERFWLFVVVLCASLWERLSAKQALV